MNDKDADQAAISAIEDGLQGLAKAFTAGDADAVAALFADDCITLPPNEPAKIGLDAVKQWHEAIFGQFSGNADLRSEEVLLAGDHAYVRGVYAMRLASADAGSVNDAGKFIMIWRCDMDGSWKITRNIWNSDNPVTSE